MIVKRVLVVLVQKPEWRNPDRVLLHGCQVAVIRSAVGVQCWSRPVATTNFQNRPRRTGKASHQRRHVATPGSVRPPGLVGWIDAHNNTTLASGTQDGSRVPSESAGVISQIESPR